MTYSATRRRWPRSRTHRDAARAQASRSMLSRPTPRRPTTTRRGRGGEQIPPHLRAIADDERSAIGQRGLKIARHGPRDRRRRGCHAGRRRLSTAAWSMNSREMTTRRHRLRRCDRVGHDELAMAERLGRGEAAIGGALDPSRSARRRRRWIVMSRRRMPDTSRSMCSPMVRMVRGLPEILMTGTMGLPMTLPCPVGKVCTT